MKNKNSSYLTIRSYSFILSSAFAGDAKNGKKIFKKCAACHNVASTAKHKTGPKLWNIVGAKAGIQDGYRYSDWLKSSGIEWNDETLAAWIGTNKEKQNISEKMLEKVG